MVAEAVAEAVTETVAVIATGAAIDVVEDVEVIEVEGIAQTQETMEGKHFFEIDSNETNQK